MRFSIRLLISFLYSFVTFVGSLIADESDLPNELVYNTFFDESPSNNHDEGEIDLPEGYALETFSEEDFVENVPQEDCENKYIAAAKKTDEELPPAIGILEAHPSAIVANCVNAISGTFFDCHVDLILPGAHSLGVQRTYSSAEKEWHFQYMPLLKVGPSGGGQHIYAAYQDDGGSGLTYRAHSGENALHIPSSLFEKGLTNCNSEEISGQTNWKNSTLFFVRDDKEKMYLLRHGSHTDRIFQRHKRYKKHHPDAPWGEFHLLKECHPNGIQLFYEYYEDHQLKTVKAANSLGQVLGLLNRSEDGTYWNTSCKACGNVQYSISNKKQLTLATPTHGMRIVYTYDNDRLTSKLLPEGRSFHVNYYDSGKDKGRVHELLAPVGANQTPVVIHRFSYDFESNRTHVENAVGDLTTYSYGENQVLNAVVQYEKNSREIHTVDSFFWAPDDSLHAGNLIMRVFQGKGKAIFCQKFDYDAFNNIKQEELWGNLTGNSKPLVINKKGIPQDICEKYIKKFLSSPDGWNLPQWEDDGRKCTQFFYYPKSNLLKCRLTITNGTILKREFFKYDDSGVLIEEIWDDGINLDQEDLIGVTERHRRITTPSQVFPIGLPEVVTESYFNIVRREYFFLKEIKNSYNEEGKIASQAHYGSDGKLAYELKWKYDELGNVSEYVNALGQTTIYKYDLNGNKLFEKSPRQDFYKEFEYDYANRLIQEKEVWDDGTILVTSHKYNPLSQRIATVDIYGQVTTFEYDVMGYLTKTRLPAMDDEKGRLIFPARENRYDGMGNIIESIDGNGHSIKKQYTVRGQPYRIEYPDGSVEKKEYTLDGLLRQETAKNGTVTAYFHDPLGRVLRTEVRDEQNTLLKQTSATYSTFQLLTETDENGLVTKYRYDPSGRRVRMIKGDRFTTYVYDPLGNLIETTEVVDKKALCTVQEYDLLGRVIEERIEDVIGQVYKKDHFEYDAVGNKTHHTSYPAAGPATMVTDYNPHGKPKKITDPLGNSTYFSYNHSYIYQGQQVLQVTRTDPLGNQEVTTYDTHGNISHVDCYNSICQLTKSEKYIYDSNDQKVCSIIQVISPNTSREIVTKWEYDSMGNIVRCVEAEGTPEQKITITTYKLGQKEKMIKPNGVILTHEYDQIGRLKSLKSSDQTIWYTYAYDLKDHPIEVEDLIHKTKNLRTYDHYGCLRAETLDTGLTLMYTYDTLNRLSGVTLPDNSSIHYRYDVNNLKAIDRIKDDTIVYTPLSRL